MREEGSSPKAPPVGNWVSWFELQSKCSREEGSFGNWVSLLCRQRNVWSEEGSSGIFSLSWLLIYNPKEERKQSRANPIKIFTPQDKLTNAS